MSDDVSNVAASAAESVTGEANPTEAIDGQAPGEGQSSEQVAADAAKQAKENLKRYKLKIDGQEREVDEKELLRGYSHQQAANKRFQEGQKLRQQAEQFVEMMKDPEKFFEVAQRLGHDPRKLSEMYLGKQLEEEFMDPKEKEIRDYKAKLQRYEEQERQKEEEQLTRQQEALKAKYAQEYSNQFIQALKETGLPATKPMVAEMAKYISRSAKIGVEMSAKEAANLVLEDIRNSQKNLFSEADGETLIKLLGEDLANKIRGYDTSKLKDPNQFLKTPTEQGQRNTRQTQQKSMTPREWRKFNRGY